DRLKMVEAAIEGIEQFSLLDYELNRPPPSYTIDTVRFLQNPESELHLILGQDSLAHLSKWKEIDQLLRMAPPFTGSRVGELPVLPPAFIPIIEAGLVTIPLMQISSTEIRARLRQGLFCGHLLPAQVLKFINQKKLYNAT
ncbi:MAG: nicotinate-nicotinamide nucleotide adenylyltransferase, partial [Chlamydiales bacterium]